MGQAVVLLLQLLLLLFQSAIFAVDAAVVDSAFSPCFTLGREKMRGACFSHKYSSTCFFCCHGSGLCFCCCCGCWLMRLTISFVCCRWPLAHRLQRNQIVALLSANDHYCLMRTRLMCAFRLRGSKCNCDRLQRLEMIPTRPLTQILLRRASAHLQSAFCFK